MSRVSTLARPLRMAKGPPPGPARDGGRGGGGAWRVVVTARDTFEATLMEGRLLSEGIEVLLNLVASPIAALKPGGDELAPVDVVVREHDWMEATLLLRVHGDRIQSSQSHSRFALSVMWWTAVALILILAFVSLEMRFF